VVTTGRGERGDDGALVAGLRRGLVGEGEEDLAPPAAVEDGEAEDDVLEGDALGLDAVAKREEVPRGGEGEVEEEDLVPAAELDAELGLAAGMAALVAEGAVAGADAVLGRADEGGVLEELSARPRIATRASSVSTSRPWKAMPPGVTRARTRGVWRKASRRRTTRLRKPGWPGHACPAEVCDDGVASSAWRLGAVRPPPPGALHSPAEASVLAQGPDDLAVLHRARWTFVGQQAAPAQRADIAGALGDAAFEEGDPARLVRARERLAR
jgi:hypothetical protein